MKPSLLTIMLWAFTIGLGALLIFLYPAYVTNSKGLIGTPAGASEGKTEAYEKATFAGGCFWCMEPAFEKLDGVSDVVVGYTGGSAKNPTYEEVSGGTSGHLEAIQVTYDPRKISYGRILDAFWRQVDPTDPGGQFVDRGGQYLTAIFYHNAEQKKMAEESKAALEKECRYSKPIVTKILPATEFYLAEDYHQEYPAKNPVRYKFYRYNSGRDKYLEKIWGATPAGGTCAIGPRKDTKMSKEDLKRTLNPLQYRVARENGTEPAFNNEYWDNKKEGIYVDVVSGEPLFSSRDKYDSGTGWPSFTKPLVPGNIQEKEDRSLFTTRTEVRSTGGDSHLGHVFDDGPGPTGLRYCMNSAALRFIPKEDLEKEGYGEYLKLFEN